MTISSTNRKAGPFDGNGVTVDFPFSFKVFTKEDVQVVRTDANAVDHVLTLDSDYSITLNADQNADPGGSIHYPISGTPLATGEKLTGIGDLQELQPTDITNLGGFFPEIIEDALDRVTILTQQLSEQLSRALLFAISDTAIGTTLPTQAIRASTVLSFDEDGNLTVSTTDAANVIAAQDAANRAEVAAATINLPSVAGKALNFLRVLADASGYEHRTAAQVFSDIGVDTAIAAFEPKSAATVTASTVHTVTAIGSTIVVNAAGATTQTLPAASAVPAGKSIRLFNIGAGTATVSRAGTDTLTINNATANTQALGTGDGLLLVSNGSNSWFVVSGSTQLANSATFARSLGATGYFKLPGGIILQYGVTSGVAGNASVAVTFPLAFPSFCRGVVVSGNKGSTGATNACVSNTPTLSGFTAYNTDGATQAVYWWAFGQ